MVNREEPQSKQTKSFGNAQTGGLSRFLSPQKWMSISVPNSLRLLDRHSAQFISHPRPALVSAILTLEKTLIGLLQVLQGFCANLAKKCISGPFGCRLPQADVGL